MMCKGLDNTKLFNRVYKIQVNMIKANPKQSIVTAVYSKVPSDH